MNRRECILALGGAATSFAFPLAAQTNRVRRIGVLSLFPDDAEWQSRIKSFRTGLAALGWVEGRNIQIDVRGVGGDLKQARSLAAEMVGEKPEVILAVATPVLVALQQETRMIPLVFVNVSDPVDGGFVKSMARPGGNVTGFTSFEYSLGGKWLELLKEAVPSLRRALVILNPENYTSRALLHVIETVAPVASVQVTSAPVHSLGEIEAAIVSFAGEPNGGVIITPDPLTTGQHRHIATLAMTHRLPTMHTFRFFPAGGGLMSYGTDNIDLYRRAASYVDRILKGAEAGELPVQNPVRYELVINLKTAKALGIEIPPMLLGRVDEVIE